jgi:Zn-dependent M28 family amino/carboxypeptidase
MPFNNHPAPASVPPFPGKSELRVRLQSHVNALAVEVGERNIWRSDALMSAASYVRRCLESAQYEVRPQTYAVENISVENLEVELPGTGRADELVIIGAHYDTVVGSPGANDNGTGVAALLELASWARSLKPSRTLRFVAFVNEEPPFFQTDGMGSVQYARRCRQRGENVVAMLALETIGFYTNEEGSQHYPFPLSLFYPSRANFIGIVGNVSSRGLVRKVKGDFKKHSTFPCEAGAVPGAIEGVGWSDHWSFWQQGYPAVMITDTALFRYDEYHKAGDTPDKIEWDGFSEVVLGLMGVTAELTGGED